MTSPIKTFLKTASDGVPAVTSHPGNNFFSIYHVGADHGIYQHYTTDPALVNWRPDPAAHRLPGSGPIYGNLSAVSLGQGLDHIFGRSGTGSVQHAWFDGKWNVEDVGGGFIGDVAAVSCKPNRIDIFVRGMDNAIFSKTYEGGKWSSWQSLGGTTVKSPSAISFAHGRIDLFHIGMDGAVYQKYFNGSSWSQNWGTLGGKSVDEVVLATTKDRHLELYVRTPENAISNRGFRNEKWSNWEELAQAGSTASRPAAVGWGGGKICVARQGSDNKLYRRDWDGSAWGNWEKAGDTAITGSPVLHPEGKNKAPAVGVKANTEVVLL